MLEKNAELWLFSQIMKCAMLASTVAPDAEQVSTFASVILQKYGNRPITHIAIFFGYAQTGQHYYDEYEIANYGTFSLSSLLNDLGNHMRIASQRKYNLEQKKNAFKSRINLLTEEAEGRIMIFEEIVANMPPDERAKAVNLQKTSMAKDSKQSSRSVWSTPSRCLKLKNARWKHG